MSEEIRLNSSKLGTKEYWNQFYRKEIDNFQHDEENTGECWFDDSDAESKIVQFIIDKLNDQELVFSQDIRIVDLGTGNGHLLYQLCDELVEEYDGEQKFRFTGIDYSPDSIQFCKEICNKKYSDRDFHFEQVDLLLKQNQFLSENKFDIILDKGTLDAIALNQEPLEQFDNKIGMQVYAGQVRQLMTPESVLLITSCNFTEEELVKIITEDGTNDLSVWDKINYPSFQFAGVNGSTICSIAFIRKEI